MEQELAAGLGEGQIAELVEDDEVEPAEMVGDAPLASCAGFGFELTDEVNDIEEAAASAAADAGAGDADGEVGLAGSRAADEHEVALVVQEPPAREVAHQRLVDRRSVEDELLDVLGERQLGDGDLV